jgi:hypothetical protein
MEFLKDDFELPLSHIFDWDWVFTVILERSIII